MPPSLPRRAFLGLLAAAAAGGPARARARAGTAAGTTLVAVAANFAATAEVLARDFATATGHTVRLTTGSTGKLYAQIGAGAPFDVLLAADAATPARLLDEGKAVAGTSFTYAVGRLTLWSPEPARIGADGRAALTDPKLRFVAIANPDLAPYGVAAREALRSLGLWETLQPKIVMGQNIGQTHSMVVSGAAEIGFVALSAVLSPRTETKGSRWDVPRDRYAPIRQDAVLLTAGAENDAAKAFLDFLGSAQAAEVIHGFGYGTAD